MPSFRNEQPQPRPFSSTENAVIDQARGSFSFFLDYVYAESFRGQKFRMADGQYRPFSLGRVHRLWADAVQRHPRVCVLAPRLHLKSTVLNTGFAFWQIFRAMADTDGMVISYKDSLAAAHTERLKSAIEQNDYCRMWKDNSPMAKSVVDYTVDFGEGYTWRGKCEPHGILSNVRGRHPKWLVCDDILSDFSNPLEPTQIRHIDAVFHSSLESLPDEADPLVVIGTPQSYEDTLYGLKSNKAYFWGRYPAEQPDGGTLWPEKFDRPRLKRTLEAVRPTAYEVEYLLRPFQAATSFLPQIAIEQCIDTESANWSLDSPWDKGLALATYGGMDVGQAVHPTHISIGAMMPTGDIVQVFHAFLDGMNYAAQALFVRRVVTHFGVRRFYYDASRSEMDDRNMPRSVLGKKFTAPLKAQLALGLEARVYAGTDEPGLLLLPDGRQLRQMVAVNKQLKSLETIDGHGDAFWSVALMLQAAHDGPVLQLLGNAQETFGRRGRGATGTSVTS